MMPYIGLLPLLWRVTRAHVRSAITKPGQSYLLQVGFAHATSAEYILPPPPESSGKGPFGLEFWYGGCPQNHVEFRRPIIGTGQSIRGRRGCWILTTIGLKLQVSLGADQD
ncbi:hypothetical protein GW17_00050868 [Ensete ventricosum]|nr:hypothetical protein GW17_00050868 [Ensete ventricosum]